MPHHLVNKNPARRGVRAGSLPTLRYNEAPADQPINMHHGIGPHFTTRKSML
jgi:hypothetical protein